MLFLEVFWNCNMRLTCTKQQNTSLKWDSVATCLANYFRIDLVRGSLVINKIPIWSPGNKTSHHLIFLEHLHHPLHGIHPSAKNQIPFASCQKPPILFKKKKVLLGTSLFQLSPIWPIISPQHSHPLLHLLPAHLVNCMDPFDICPKLPCWKGPLIVYFILHPLRRMYSRACELWLGMVNENSPYVLSVSCRLNWGQRDPKLEGAGGTSFPQHVEFNF